MPVKNKVGGRESFQKVVLVNSIRSQMLQGRRGLVDSATGGWLLPKERTGSPTVRRVFSHKDRGEWWYKEKSLSFLSVAFCLLLFGCFKFNLGCLSITDVFVFPADSFGDLGLSTDNLFQVYRWSVTYDG